MSNPSTLSEGQLRRSIAFGYSSPIVGLTLAFVIGAGINDLFGNVTAWTWFAIQALIGTSIILGAHFSAYAVAYGAAHGHVAAGRGASRLNLVLAYIWFFFVGIQSFTYGAESASYLLDYSGVRPVMKAATAQFWLNNFLPAQMFIVLALAGIFFFVNLRSKGQTN